MFSFKAQPSSAPGQAGPLGATWDCPLWTQCQQPGAGPPGRVLPRGVWGCRSRRGGCSGITVIHRNSNAVSSAAGLGFPLTASPIAPASPVRPGRRNPDSPKPR